MMTEKYEPMQDGASVLSDLKISPILFDEVSFKRIGFKQEGNDNLKLNVGVSVHKEGEGQYRVSLTLEAEKEEEFIAKVSVTGFCEIDEDYSRKDDVLRKNAVAILFPYARTELTLITAQPETEPIVLPAFNINALAEKADERSSND